MAETFNDWFHRTLPNINFFAPEELLVKGGSHSNNGLNTDPPPELWNNARPLIHLLEFFREWVGVPIVLSSVYRSPAYNQAIGGAARSQHMQFRAADFHVAGRGAPADWAATLRQFRSQGAFSGGIGIYDTFVHVDVRGTNVDWDERRGARTPGKVLPEWQPDDHLEGAPPEGSGTGAAPIATIPAGVVFMQTASNALWWIGLGVVLLGLAWIGWKLGLWQLLGRKLKKVLFGAGRTKG